MMYHDDQDDDPMTPAEFFIAFAQAAALLIATICLCAVFVVWGIA